MMGEPISQPGVYDIPDDVYHADPVPGGSLSSTGARKLLPPSCPALFRHWVDHDQRTTPALELGKAAHRRVFGAGPELVLVDRERWDTKEVKAEVAAIRAAGNLPIKRADLEIVDAMTAALRAHPIVRALFAPDAGEPERSLFWSDRVGGWCRARLDWLPKRRMGRVILADYKTCACAERDAIERAIFDRQYHMQADWYLSGTRALDLAGPDAAFVFVFQEKTPPYLVNVVEPDALAMRIGHDRNRRALEVYRECRLTDRWPGYSEDVESVGLPAWAETRYLQETS